MYYPGKLLKSDYGKIYPYEFEGLRFVKVIKYSTYNIRDGRYLNLGILVNFLLAGSVS